MWPFRKLKFIFLIISCLSIYVIVHYSILNRPYSKNVYHRHLLVETNIDKNEIQKDEIITEKPMNLSDIFNVPGWSYNTSRNTRNYILPDKITILNQPKFICGTDRNEPDGIFLLIIICSGMGNFEARSAIRQTWGNQSNYEVLARTFDKINKYFIKVNVIDELLKTILDEDTKMVSNNTLNDDVLEYKTAISYPVKCLFLLGQSLDDKHMELQSKINDESNVYGDIIQEGFVDSYNNLTLKSLMMLKWITSNCKDSVRYIMKTDDDMYINIPQLIKVLQIKSEEHISKFTLQPYNITKVEHKDIVKQEKLLIGDLRAGSQPVKNTASKWYCPDYMFNGTVFPNYLLGSGYAMSYTVAEMIYKEALDTEIFYFEDVFLTGINSQKAGIKPIDHPAFAFSKQGLDLCTFGNLISTHGYSPLKLKEMHNIMLESTEIFVICEMKWILEKVIKEIPKIPN